MLNVTGERECCVSSVGIVKSKSNGVTSSVEGLSQITNQISDEISERLRERLNKFDLVNLPSRLRIGFDNLCVWIEIVELSDSLVEIGQEIFLSPCELAARTSERV